MRRLLSTLLALSLAVTLATPQTTFAKEGAACKQVGTTKKFAGKMLTCTKSGKKLTWRAGKVAPIPSPSPSLQFASATTARAGDGCFTKGDTSQTGTGPLICDGTWKVVAESDDSVESRAFRIVLNEYLSRPEGELSLIWRVDPKTPAWKDRVKDGMVAGARLWGTSPAGSSPRYVYVSTDGNWIIDRAKEDGLLRPDSTREYQGVCNAGIVGDDFDKQSYWYYKFSAAQCVGDIGFYQVGAHEYTHYAQEALSKRQWQKVKQVPWLDEGLASFIGGALGPFGAGRNDLRRLWLASTPRVFRDLKFFSAGEMSVYRDASWGDVYPMGAMAAEGMVALIELEGIRKIYTELAIPGTTYEEAFQRATGMSVATWTELLQGYFDSVRKGAPWSLAKLQSEYAAKR